MGWGKGTGTFVELQDAFFKHESMEPSECLWGKVGFSDFCSLISG